LNCKITQSPNKLQASAEWCTWHGNSKFKSADMHTLTVILNKQLVMNYCN